MQRDKSIVLQPYGKDEVSMNFIVSPMGRWVFGPTDPDKLPIIRKNAAVFNFVRFRGKNPKYYIKPIPENYSIKSTSHRKRWNITHDTTGCNAIYFFLFYEPSENFVAMNYTTKESEYDTLDANMNLLSTIVFYGKDLTILEEEWEHGITIERPDLLTILEAMKNEHRQIYK
jgi:hypothetical protein